MARKRQAARAVKALGLGKALDFVAGSVCEVSTSRPVFHLTFDDGPHPEVTLPVLDVLAESNVIATFFLLADPAKRYPEIVGETLARGHEIGLHGRTHLRLSTAPWSAITDEISKAHAELEEVAGRPVKFFRPPYGAHGIRSLAVTRARGMKTVLWSADTDDWKGGLTPAEPLQGTTNRMASGGISLQHDTPVGESIAEDEAKGLIGKDVLTHEVIAEIERRGLQPVSLQELLSTGVAVRRAKVIR